MVIFACFETITSSRVAHLAASWISFLAIFTFSLGAIAQQERPPVAAPGAIDDLVYAHKLFDEGFYDLCVVQVQAYMERYPEAQGQAQAWQLLGEANMALQRYEAAEQAFRTCEIRFPFANAIAEVRLQLAEAQRSQSKFEMAAVSFQRTALFHPTWEKAAYAEYSACEMWFADGQFDRSRAALFQFIDKNVTSTYQLPAHLLLVRTLNQLAEPARALKEADRLFLKFPQTELSAEAYYVRGQLQEQLGQYQLAESTYTDLTARYKDGKWVTAAHVRLGELLIARGDIAAGIAAFERALALTTESAERNHTALHVADLALASGRAETAMAMLQRFEVTAADSLQLLRYHHHWGAVKQAKGDHQAAVQAFRKGVRLQNLASKSRDKTVSQLVQQCYVGAARAAAQSADGKTVVQLCRDYRNAFPDGDLRDEMLLLEGKIHLREFASPARAQRIFFDLIESYPHSKLVDEAQFELAGSYEAADEWQNARKQWEVFLKLYPASELAITAERRLRIANSLAPGPNHSQTESPSAVRMPHSGWDAELLGLKLLELHYQRADYYEAIRLARQALPSTTGNSRSALLYYLGASYYGLADYAQAKEQPYSVWQDSARTALQAIVTAADNNAYRPSAALMLARLQFNDDSPRTVETLVRADSLLLWFGESVEWDWLRLWAARLRKQFTSPADPATGERIVLALQRVASNVDSPLSNAALFELAAWYQATGDSAAASQTIERLNSSSIFDSYHAKAQLQQVTQFAAHGRYDDAITKLEAFEQRYYYGSVADSARTLRVRYLMAAGRYREALDLMSGRGLPELSASDGTDLIRARLLEKTGDDSRAIQSYLRFIEKHPNAPESAQVLLAAAQAAERLDSRQVAMQYYQECVKRFPNTPQSEQGYFRLGEIHYDRGEFESARENYQALLLQNPNAAQAREAAIKGIQCLFKAEKVAQANTEIERFKKQFDDRDDAMARFLYAEGELALQTKNYKAAERTFDRLAGKYRDTELGIMGEYGVAKTLLAQNKFEDAIKKLTAIPGRFPGHVFLPTVYLGLGDFYQANQQWDNAISSFNMVVKDSTFDHNFRLAFRSLIDVYDRMGLKDRALAMSRYYINKFPDDAKTFDLEIKVALFLIDLAQFTDAINHLTRLKPFADRATEPEIQYYIGKSYMNAGQFERAIAELLRVKYYSQTGKLPWDVISLYEAGQCYKRLDNCSKARQLFRQIVREQGGASDFGRFAQIQLDELRDCVEPN